MNSEEIRSHLNTKWAAGIVDYKDITGSTNDTADDAGKRGEPSGFLAVADRQDSGRGSRGRSWVSPAGYNIFMSIMLRPTIPMDKAPGLTLVMAISIAQAVEDELTAAGYNLEACGPQIKWPNDIVLNKRKICGILTELRPQEKGYYVIIGVGINVNQPVEEFPEDIRQTAGSILAETGIKLQRSKLIAAAMKHFERNYEAYMEKGDLSGTEDAPLKTFYEDRLINVGNIVKIVDPDEEYEAKAIGITDSGALVVETQDGKQEEINAGEVSVRGLYGYV
ncbi:MAG: biotin--[acetyl-CoA-carboxylase] ligase [Butyrivibrio sp.]|nr:biotin--[acetyl-CoA-carboxylase] ligase [Butyrivibrio sp.]